MYIPFENLPEESRIWIYQSNRKFSDDEVTEIENDLKAFVEDWSAHGTSLEASYIIQYNRFISALFVLEVVRLTKPTFCSGDINKTKIIPTILVGIIQ